MKAEILELVNRDHFRHFAIITAAGVRYDITDPNALAAARDKVHYYFPNSDRAIHVPYDQIATVEELPGTRSKR
ncbi:MAG TPA: hypothetical protein VM008_07805 [Phycisphaerae bacterium]|nr:hypothetical protein [Phycisphaerae bacterium]